MLPRALEIVLWFGTYGPPDVSYFDVTVASQFEPQTAKLGENRDTHTVTGHRIVSLKHGQRLNLSSTENLPEITHDL